MKRTLVVVMVVACGSSPTAPTTPMRPPEPPPVAEGPPPTPPELRLPDLAKPSHEQVDLVLDPKSEDFTGRITTQLEVTRPTRVLWLNALEITVDDASITIGGQRIAAKAITPKKAYLGLVFASELPAGKGTLDIKYRGKMHRNDGDGIYTAQEAGDWYVFTQFEATDARQAFPCFDEPSYKIPWQLTIHTNKPLVALSNTPVESETDEPNGMKAVKFAETKPLPSYLVAFAVGPFEAIDAGKTQSGVPIRIVVPKGRTADAAYPVKSTKRILDALEDYFGSPYPYPKLDALAVSVFNAGAMENPGLITYREEIILTKPEDMRRDKEREYATVAAHEMAHQWFGDEVTLAWWDDTWLNESFASWMEVKVMTKLEPSWQLDVDMVAAKARVMAADSLDTARMIRQPIVTADDILNSFDGITYGKGQAVLTMLENTIGTDVWQKGVRGYIAKHAFANATYDDFVTAMSEAAGKDERPLFDAFVKQSGVPLVSVELSCAKGAAPKLVLEQRRYAPTGSSIDPKRTWQLPMCVKWGAGTATGRDCTLLTAATGELPLSAKTCPTWVLPNENELGYYRFSPKGKLLDNLLANTRKLSLGERVGLIGDVNALVGNGEAPIGEALQLVADLAKDKSRHIVDQSIGITSQIDELVSDKQRPNYERFIKKMYAARARELGFQTRPGDDDNTKELRAKVLALVGGVGKDAEVAKQASTLVWKWFDDHKAIDPSLVATTLGIAARVGDQKLWDRMHQEAAKSTDRDERARMLAAMGHFSDPKLVEESMTLFLGNEFDIREAAGLLQQGFQIRTSRPIAYEFVKTHFDDIVAKLPVQFRPYMAFILVSMCDDAKKPEFESFFKPRIDKFDGGPRAMAQAEEQLHVCSAARKAEAPGVEAFLKNQ
jgi:alanyl aminopeptidase